MGVGEVWWESCGVGGLNAGGCCMQVRAEQREGACGGREDRVCGVVYVGCVGGKAGRSPGSVGVGRSQAMLGWGLESFMLPHACREIVRGMHAKCMHCS